ncbi:hypothetical protein PYK79_52550 [Streptomyces sp. ID05-04B]|uniref:hypothetical protein n=1 Tax=Streptomyces sp. ID05-04B TaxID=3028661 RepID=UPI0029C23B12|nr:hypothetical protein [Streptomyces sp. ID05-04B]MDX5570204.1 hypothetical protein [Streptomyces sp. ID05-04B]
MSVLLARTAAPVAGAGTAVTAFRGPLESRPVAGHGLVIVMPATGSAAAGRWAFTGLRAAAAGRGLTRFGFPARRAVRCTPVEMGSR